MTTDLSFANNAISVFMYEPFSYTISNPNTGLYTLSTTITSGIPPTYLTSDVSRAVFATTSNAMVPGTQQFTVSTNVSGTIIGNSVNTVTVGAGRFLDGSGLSFVGSNFTFYAKEAITPITLKAPFPLASPVTSTPVLPPGLAFSALDGSRISITGTPSITSPQTNYLIIGRQAGTSKVVSSILPIVISNERIRTNITGGGLIGGMQIGTAITPATLTAIGNGTFRYTWAPFPDGLRATDNSGTTVTSPFSPTDPSDTLIITGTPTLAAANSFINLGYSNGLTQSITVQRTTPAPVITSIVDVTFQFGETVLFDTPSNPTLIKNIALDISSNYFFRAQTYFNGNVDMSSISNTGALPTGLSLTFNGVDRAYLTGTPTTVGSASYTIRATNSNAKTRDIAPTISVINDVVTLTAPTDTCYNFVLSRTADLSLTGYYPSPITFSAIAASGKSIAWSAPALSGTGLSLSASTGKTTTITGRPTAVTSLRNLRITATSFDTSETAQYDASFAILNDVFTLNRPIVSERLSIQNRPITPFQMTASTLSGNPIVFWSATSTASNTRLIPGTTISAGGVISGTPLSNWNTNPIFTLSTGYVTSNIQPVWGFYSAPDTALVTLPNGPQTVPLTFSGVEFTLLDYSQTADTSLSVSTSRAPWQGSNFTASFAGNYLQGDFSGIALLPKYRLGITGHAGTASNTWPMDINVSNPPTFVRHILGVDVSAGESTSLKLVRNTGPSVALDSSMGYTYSANVLSWSNANAPSGVLSNVPYGIHDMAENESVIVAVLGSNMIRSVDAGNTWYTIPSSNIQSIDVSGGVPPSVYTARPLFGCIATDGTSNWVALANGSTGSSFYNIVRTSSNNGADWVDTSVNNFVNINSNTKLFYNNSRYFVTAGAAATNPLLYASSSNPTTWTSPSGLTTNDALNGLAFNNNTALVVGSNGTSSACYSSSNNGTTWTPLPSSPITYSGAAQINTAGYAYGKWVVGGTTAGGAMITRYSADLSSWTTFGIGLGLGTFHASVEDGSAWLFAGSGTNPTGYTARWLSSGNPQITQGWGTGALPLVSSKRIVSTTVSNGTPSLTLRILYDTGGLAFDSPTNTSFLFWQYVPIPTIRLEANHSGPPPLDVLSEIYYVTTTLPDGLTLLPDQAGSLSATITGTSVAYRDAPYVVRAYAFAYDPANLTVVYVTDLTLTMRTVLPTVYKQQTSAGAWTSLVRQYTEVNAATTARDSRATPAIEYRLGEFTSPEPPSVITASSNCLC
jgi:hypothetical protein